MSSLMRRVLEEVLKMPYYKNYAAESGKVHNVAKHEDAVAAVLKKHGLKELSKEQYMLGALGFVLQPNGTHSSPDFWVRPLEGKHYDLESKSVKGSTTAPMYNSGLPKPDMIYIFCCQKYDETTIYYGRDVMGSNVYDLMESYRAECKERDKQFNARLKEARGDIDMNINWYTRPMMTHKGSEKDYFQNEHRQERERRVLESV